MAGQVSWGWWSAGHVLGSDWSGNHRPGAAGAGPRPGPGAGAHLRGRDDRRHRHRRQDHQPEV